MQDGTTIIAVAAIAAVVLIAAILVFRQMKGSVKGPGVALDVEGSGRSGDSSASSGARIGHNWGIGKTTMKVKNSGVIERNKTVGVAELDVEGEPASGVAPKKTKQ